MSELLGASGTLGALGIALLIFGFLPGFVLAGVVRLIPDPDRRRELQAELYEVPRWGQPFWVVQQLEVAIRIGVFPEIGWQWGRHVWHRSKIECGMDIHRQHPETFEVPDAEAKAELRPGDRVKLAWSVKRRAGERMWVTLSEREGDKLAGVLDNCALMANLYHGEKIKFRVDDIIDCILEDDEQPPQAA